MTQLDECELLFSLNLKGHNTHVKLVPSTKDNVKLLKREQMSALLNNLKCQISTKLSSINLIIKLILC